MEMQRNGMAGRVARGGKRRGGSADIGMGNEILSGATESRGSKRTGRVPEEAKRKEVGYRWRRGRLFFSRRLSSQGLRERKQERHRGQKVGSPGYFSSRPAADSVRSGEGGRKCERFRSGVLVLSFTRVEAELYHGAWHKYLPRPSTNAYTSFDGFISFVLRLARRLNFDCSAVPHP